MNNVTSSTIIVTMLVFMFLGWFWVVSISFMDAKFTTTHNFNIDNETRDVLVEVSKQKSSIWSEDNKCDLILEQNVACIQACHYLSSQGEILNSQHSNCMNFCDKKYYVDVEGNNYNGCTYNSKTTK